MATSPNTDSESWARTAGALLVNSADPWVASTVLEAYVLRPDSVTREDLGGAGIIQQLVEDFRHLLPTDAEGLAKACRLGAAWEAGRRTQPAAGSWRPVATWIGGVQGIRHRTAETMISLLIRARRHVRLFAPFVDRPGLNALALAVSSATARHVVVEVAIRPQGQSLVDEVLVPAVGSAGNPAFLRVRVLPESDAFPHLKVLSVDQKLAYIGSANLTWPALIHNVELGVLVDGEQVAVLDELFDQMLVERATNTVD
jgi:hypothetical protein